MRALSITALLLFAAGALFAQKNNVETASIAVGKYDSRKEAPAAERSSYIKEAKKFIDLAKDHETTNNYFKMWFVRGKVYYFLALDTLGNKELDPDPVEKAVKSLLKSQKTDVKGKYEDETYGYLAGATAMAYNEGVVAFFDSTYDRALKYFNLTIEAIPKNKKEILQKYNVDEGKVKSTAASTAMRLENYDMAKKYLNELIDARYADPTIYMSMTDLLLKQGDTAKALEALTTGRDQFEDNQSLIIYELNTYITLKRMNVLIDRLTAAIESDPYNEQFYFNRGTVYQERADQLTKEGNAEESEKMAMNAVADYTKALELNADYFDALQNLGGYYLNKGVSYTNEANGYSYKEKAKTDAALAKANEYYTKAMPYLEHAYELDDQNTRLKKALEQIYLSTEQLEKYKAIKAQ